MRKHDDNCECVVCLVSYMATGSGPTKAKGARPEPRRCGLWRVCGAPRSTFLSALQSLSVYTVVASSKGELSANMSAKRTWSARPKSNDEPRCDADGRTPRRDESETAPCEHAASK